MQMHGAGFAGASYPIAGDHRRHPFALVPASWAQSAARASAAGEQD